MNRNDQEDAISRQMNSILSLTKDSALDEAGMSQFDHCPPDEAAQPYPRIAYEWNFVGQYIGRVIESAPGIVHFEEARIERGDPAAMRFARTDNPMGTANELLQLNARWMNTRGQYEDAEEHCQALIADRQRFVRAILDLLRTAGDFQGANADHDRALRMAREACLVQAPTTFTSEGAARIVAERRRQIEVEGFAPENDERNALGDMAAAGASYAANAFSSLVAGTHDTDPGPPDWWPWDAAWWKPKDPIRDLERAGALIAAELDRVLNRERGDG